MLHSPEYFEDSSRQDLIATIKDHEVNEGILMAAVLGILLGAIGAAGYWGYVHDWASFGFNLLLSLVSIAFTTGVFAVVAWRINKK